MDIHDQANNIVRQVEDKPKDIQASAYEQEKAQRYVEIALEEHKGEGNFEYGDCQSMFITNPMSGVYSMQFWFVTIIDKSTMTVRGDIFMESRD